MTKTIFRRVFPPAFLRAATARKVDVGAYLPPARKATDVWVGQTEEQYANALGLCTQLEAEYAGERLPVDRPRPAGSDGPAEGDSPAVYRPS